MLCCSWRRWCSGRSVVMLCGALPLCVPVGGGPPARSPHASLRLGVVDLEARPGPAATHRHRGRALPPPTGTAARPATAAGSRYRPRARQPGPATTHGHRSRAPPPAHRYGRALRSLRRPPHQWGRVADVWLCASSRSPARPRHRPRAPQPGPPDPPAPSTPASPRLLLRNFACNSRTPVVYGPIESSEFQRLHAET